MQTATLVARVDILEEDIQPLRPSAEAQVSVQVKVHSESMHGLHEDQQKLKNYIDEEDQFFLEWVNCKHEAFREEWHVFQNDNNMLVSEAKTLLCGIMQQQSEQKTAQNSENILAQHQLDILQTTLKRHQNLLAAGSERLAMLEQFGEFHVRRPADSMLGVDDAFSGTKSPLHPTTVTKTAQPIGLPTQIKISPIVARLYSMHTNGAQVLSPPECLIEIDLINSPLTIQPCLEVDEQDIEQELLPGKGMEP